MSIAEYTIKIDSGNYGLSIDPGNTSTGSQLVIEDYSENSELQRWQLLYDPATSGAVIYNPYLQVFAGPDGGRVITYSYNPQENFSGRCWQICGSKSAAIRLQNNEDANMNAEGGGDRAGQKIIFWTWNGSKDNMQWTCKPMAGPISR